jgi:uncharacterized protein YidB (DUF937 family)
MGLIDVLNGMKNGPRGQPTPSGSPGGSGGGMSPITMGLLAWLAYKALKGGGILGSGTSPAQQQPQTPLGRPSPQPDQAGGPDWLDGLGKLIAGGAGGSILSGGLGELIKKLQQGGQGQAAQSWLGTGPNQSVSQGDLEKALGGDTLEELSRQTGVSRDRLLSELSEHLPKTVDTLTPHGRLPSDEEASRWT